MTKGALDGALERRATELGERLVDLSLVDPEALVADATPTEAAMMVRAFTVDLERSLVAADELGRTLVAAAGGLTAAQRRSRDVRLARATRLARASHLERCAARVARRLDALSEGLEAGL